MVRWIRTPFRLLDEAQRRYGDTFTLPLPFGPSTLAGGGLVALSDPSDIKEVFGFGPDDAHAGEANVVLKPFLGRNSLLLLDGAQHLRHRKMILPAFHGERMLAYGDAMIEAADDAVDGMPVGRTFAVHRPMQSLTLKVILRTVFGVAEGPRFRDLADVLTKSLDAIAWPPMIFPFMQHDLGPLSPWGRWLRLRDRASKLLRAEIREARAAQAKSRTDVLSMLDARRRAASDDEVHDELITLLVAGHETTATSLAWALRWILPNRRLLGEMREEIASAGGDPAKIAKLELLDDVAKETLRLQPVIPMVGRVLQEPRRIGQWDLPRGALVAPAIYLVHRRPSLYPNPTAFEPKRFRTLKPAAWELLAVRRGPPQMRRRVFRDLRDEDGARDDPSARRDAPRRSGRSRRAAEHHDHAVERAPRPRHVQGPSLPSPARGRLTREGACTCLILQYGRRHEQARGSQGGRRRGGRDGQRHRGAHGQRRARGRAARHRGFRRRAGSRRPSRRAPPRSTRKAARASSRRATSRRTSTSSRRATSSSRPSSRRSSRSARSSRSSRRSSPITRSSRRTRAACASPT